MEQWTPTFVGIKSFILQGLAKDSADTTLNFVENLNEISLLGLLSFTLFTYGSYPRSDVILEGYWKDFTYFRNI